MERQLDSTVFEEVLNMPFIAAVENETEDLEAWWASLPREERRELSDIVDRLERAVMGN